MTDAPLVWGAAAVDAAAADGVLRVGARDVVTPLARERARELRVEIVVETPGTAAALAGDARPAVSASSASCRGELRIPSGRVAGSVGRAGAGGAAPAARPADTPGAPARLPRPPSGALYRRGAPVTATETRAVVVGAGHVGMIAAQRLAEADVFTEVVLVDIDEGRAAGVALDLVHVAGLGGFATAIRGVGSIEEAGRADHVIVTAGRPRQPGMSRSDLISTNAEIVGDVARRVAATSPDAVLLVVTNPLDEMTQHAWRESGFPPRRVLGMAGVLDTARFQALVGLTGVARADRVHAWALGSHGEEMVIPLSQATADGRPLTDLLPAADLAAIVDRARGSGAEVVGLLKSGSAFFAPGRSAADMVLAMVADSGAVVPAAVLADGTYGIRDVYVGLPARLGRGGVREIVELPLEPLELAALREAADRIRDRLGALVS